MLRPKETHVLEVNGHKVSIYLEQYYEFEWRAKVEIPLGLLDSLDFLICDKPLYDWERGETVVFTEVFCGDDEKEGFLLRVKEELVKIESRLAQIKEWREQPARYYEMSGGVKVTVSPDTEQFWRYRVDVVAPRALIERADKCGLWLGRTGWLRKGDHVESTWVIFEEKLEGFLAKIEKSIGEALETELVAQYIV